MPRALKLLVFGAVGNFCHIILIAAEALPALVDFAHEEEHEKHEEKLPHRNKAVGLAPQAQIYLQKIAEAA